MTSFTGIAPVLGAEVTGLDLRRLSDRDVELLRRRILMHRLLVFRDQHLDTHELQVFAERWGPIDTQELDEQPYVTGSSRLARAATATEVQALEHNRQHPASGYQWHTDIAWTERPNCFTVLSATVVPPLGGDTVYCNMAAAYAGLSPRLQHMITGLTARHDRLDELVRRRGITGGDLAAFLERHPPVDHPVVCAHPETSEPVLFVNPQTTRHINELPPDESAAILGLLFAQTHKVEYQCHLSWSVGAVAIWDNRVLQHTIVNDYFPERRRMERVAVAGERPLSPTGEPGPLA
jgi:taurine dioxygenase